MSSIQILRNQPHCVCPAAPEGKADYKVLNGTYFHIETPDAVCEALERARLSEERVRLFYGDVKTGVAWAEENDAAGRIGRSTGKIKSPLLINNSRSSGGPAFLDRCIVAILCKNPKRFVYKHKDFSVGRWETVQKSERAEYVSEVLHNGAVHARFVKVGQAERYVDFMTGERLSK